LPWLFLHFLLWNIPCPPRYISARASAESQASCMDGHSLRRRRPNWCWPSHTYLACFLRVSRFFVSAARHAYVRTAWSDLGVEALRQQRNSRTRLGFRPSLWSTPDVPPDVYSVVLEPALCCASLCGQAFSVEDENDRNATVTSDMDSRGGPARETSRSSPSSWHMGRRFLRVQIPHVSCAMLRDPTCS